ncbi:aminotransferase class V-fold PLP-dependent enzyme [Pseudemcibacter aquimaris]|uniref:aminotransferase class V-fold PLP-dependent enzyme n=1 Tax=Pseudemcibacter aquimaris TaxID=2857064 RepID=UPI002011F5C1|nr:aminotransferase class V-fold PLP-dependent enzyme [Pseudemcibacter aquimaris]MCC3861550.1 aminotransferase class V-fold PLP-dependent enzyme [Pseudemcibacter aquimaris]WDU58319.1 aminotransferase class V-fold PLP-dependent enzyme [Pseudemcibacter aquimaris]
MKSMRAYREHFPIFKNTVYINSCSYAALSLEVEGAFQRYLKDRHEVGADWIGWCDRLERVRSLFADLLSAKADEMAVTTSASASLSAISSSLDFSGKRKKIVTTDLAFPTEAQAWHALKKHGAEVVHVKETDGMIDLDDLDRLVDDETLLVAVPLVCYRNGALADIPAIRDIARKNGALILVDAYQGVGAVPIDVNEWKVDFIVGGSLKYLLSTAGVGFLYVREDLITKSEPTQTGWFAQEDIHAMLIHDNIPATNARRFEQGTPSVPNLYAVEAGLKLILEVGVENIREHVAALNERLKKGVQEIGGKLMSPMDPNKHGAMITVASTDEYALVAALAERNIIASCRDGNLRISAHFYNNNDDIDAVIGALKDNKNLLA